MKNKIQPSVMLFVLIISIAFLTYIYFENSKDYAFFSMMFLFIIAYSKAYIIHEK